MNKTKQWIQTISICALLLAVPMSYNSCSADHAGDGIDGLSSVGAKACGLDEFFSRSWQPFLQKQCATCHIVGGQGKGAFADQNLGTAFNAFSLVGFARVGNYAVDGAHNPPYSGPANQGEVDNLLTEWAAAEVEAESRCGEDGQINNGRVEEDFSVWMRTRSKGIGASAVGDAMELTWDLESEMLPANLPSGLNLTGAQVGITVEVRDNLGDIYYAIYNPRLDLQGASEDLTLRGIAINLNGQVIDDQTAFFYIDEGRRDGDGPVPALSSGAMIIERQPSRSDVIGLMIKGLENIDLGPRPQGVTVDFAQGRSMTVNESGSRTIDLNLSRKAVNTNEITVNVSTGSSNTAKPVESSILVRNQDGVEIPRNNHDWDYDLQQTTVIFYPGETTKTITFDVADDSRYEQPGGNDESFFLELLPRGVQGGAAPGSVDRTVITITDNDTEPTPGIPTYDQLLSEGGTLNKYCIRCHNSVDMRGGYDVTNYQQMLDKDVLRPSQPNLSDMFIRMSVEQDGINTMPLTGSIDITEQEPVRQWILNGAKND